MFTDEGIRILAAGEVAMDEGTQPFVRSNGVRMAVNSEVMAELNLVQGQTVSPVITRHIMQKHLANITAKIAINKSMTD